MSEIEDILKMVSSQSNNQSEEGEGGLRGGGVNILFQSEGEMSSCTDCEVIMQS